MNNIIAIDCGYGDTKICINGNLYKEISCIAKVDSEDSHTISYDGGFYYVFDDATKLPVEKQINISTYQDIKWATPLFTKMIQLKYGLSSISKLVLGLSLVMSDEEKVNSLIEYVKEQTGIPEVIVLRQGVGCYYAYKQYGADKDTSITSPISQNYLGVDIGFNTIDVFQVINGELSVNATLGYPE